MAIAPIPEGYHSVTPWIIVRGVPRFLDFLKDAFGAEETARVPNADGSIGHAEVRIGDSVVMMFDARGTWPDAPAFLRLYVGDGSAAFDRALNAGATPVTEMTELFWGDRVGRVRDPWGNIWWIQQRVEVVDPDDLPRRSREPRFVEGMRYVQESLDAALETVSGR